MIISKDFVGGNIEVVDRKGNDVYLKNELRDTQGDWFYWAFCVENAAGESVTFHFGRNRLGYFGPAVSRDLKKWQWLGKCGENEFTYNFGKDENRVYFAHSMLYHPDRFYAFAAENGIKTREFCKSRKGRSVPCMKIGGGDISVILTARHHACESTGNYVLEGVLRELISDPLPNAK
ncbi:MAG: hypothetical protein IJS67_02290, partial [Clostridia bacterium]|nr:hypothetical protein [Clostridia bacterium]